MGARHRNRKLTRIRSGLRTGWILALVGLVAFIGMTCWLAIRRPHASPTVRAARQSFGATIENQTPSSGPAPEGMVWIPGGEFSMGANDPPDMDDVGMRATLDARPIHRVYVDGFYIDKTDVTNAEFAEFVKATGYVTIAERKPRAEDFPGAPPENLAA
ncbi:MAG: SUMF1/EgtB/PvdO family nonheme iron enzyme, partial [Acidobacteriaceae bacterium]|nr:SUMF1/EgtB/PvdO family nonheme iron enzyme [Acidobacteriaceae bacterium]